MRSYAGRQQFLSNHSRKRSWYEDQLALHWYP